MIVVWHYRIIYFVNEKMKVVEIKEIQSRGNVSYD